MVSAGSARHAIIAERKRALSPSNWLVVPSKCALESLYGTATDCLCLPPQGSHRSERSCRSSGLIGPSGGRGRCCPCPSCCCGGAQRTTPWTACAHCTSIRHLSAFRELRGEGFGCICRPGCVGCVRHTYPLATHEVSSVHVLLSPCHASGTRRCRRREATALPAQPLWSCWCCTPASPSAVLGCTACTSC